MSPPASQRVIVRFELSTLAEGEAVLALPLLQAVSASAAAADAAARPMSLFMQS